MQMLRRIRLLKRLRLRLHQLHAYLPPRRRPERHVQGFGAGHRSSCFWRRGSGSTHLSESGLQRLQPLHELLLVFSDCRSRNELPLPLRRRPLLRLRQLQRRLRLGAAGCRVPALLLLYMLLQLLLVLHMLLQLLLVQQMLLQVLLMLHLLLHLMQLRLLLLRIQVNMTFWMVALRVVQLVCKLLVRLHMRLMQVLLLAVSAAVVLILWIVVVVLLVDVVMVMVWRMVQACGQVAGVVARSRRTQGAQVVASCRMGCGAAPGVLERGGSRIGERARPHLLSQRVRLCFQAVSALLQLQVPDLALRAPMLDPPLLPPKLLLEVADLPGLVGPQLLHRLLQRAEELLLAGRAPFGLKCQPLL